MGIEYIAFIAEDHYTAFKIILSTTLPRDYGMWLRVRERGKHRAFTERAATVTEVEVSPLEFGAYCKGLKRTDFSVASLDRYAREKAVAQGRRLRAAGAGAPASAPNILATAQSRSANDHAARHRPHPRP
jgi:hypothetical protein